MRFDHTAIAYSLEMSPPLISRESQEGGSHGGHLGKQALQAACALSITGSQRKPECEQAQRCAWHLSVPGAAAEGLIPPFPGQPRQHGPRSSRGAVPRCPSSSRLSRCSCSLPHCWRRAKPGRWSAGCWLLPLQRPRSGHQTCKAARIKTEPGGLRIQITAVPTAPRPSLHLARCSLSLLLSHFLMHFCLATKHELCYQKLIS